MILSLDISTTTVGLALIQKNNVVLFHAIELKKQKSLYDKLDVVKKYFTEDDDFKSYKKKIKEIRVEQFLMNFRRGFSSAATITKLAGFNTAVRWMMYDLFSIRPYSINPVSARSSLGINVVKDEDTKEQVMKWVESTHKINLPTKIMKGGPNKGKKVRHPSANDIADAIVIGLVSDTSILIDD